MKCLSLVSNAGILLLNGTHYVFDKDVSHVEIFSVSLDFLLFFLNHFHEYIFYGLSGLLLSIYMSIIQRSTHTELLPLTVCCLF